jgi:acetate---CoA ligase (ADP-forming)
MIGLYLENVSGGRRLLEIARRARKPIVVLKANRTPASREIARFHTTALAGDDEVADAAFRQAGMHRVGTLGEMMEVFKAFLLPPMAGNRVGVLCRSGGQGVILADAVHRAGFRLAQYSDAVYDTIRRETRAGVIRMTNPLDLGDIFDFRFYFQVLEKALQEPGVDGVVFGQTYLHSAQIPETQDLIRAALELSQRYNKPVIMYLIASRKFHFPLKQTCAMPLFSDADQALSALAVSHRFQLRQRAIAGQPPGVVFHSIPATFQGERDRFLPPEEAFALLASCGIPHPPFAVVVTRGEALDAARRIGYPVALKTADPAVLHKTEAGGVKLNIGDERALEEALERMPAGSWLVQKMMPPGREMIVGGKQDREFGPLVLFGLGGILTEVLRDVALRVAPLTLEEAGSLIEETRGAALLKGFRGEAPSDVAALRELVAAVSRLLADHPEIRTLDMNPVVVYGQGEGCCAVDVKIQASPVPASAAVKSP